MVLNPDFLSLCWNNLLDECVKIWESLVGIAGKLLSMFLTEACALVQLGLAVHCFANFTAFAIQVLLYFWDRNQTQFKKQKMFFLKIALIYI